MRVFGILLVMTFLMMGYNNCGRLQSASTLTQMSDGKLTDGGSSLGSGSGSGGNTGGNIGGIPTPGQTPTPTLTPTVNLLDDSKVSYSAPITITKGGTYTGNWKSDDPTIPAVTVKTSEPVVIQNCRTKAKGHGISAPWIRANLTVKNCIGMGMNPNVAGRATGRFISAEGFESMVVSKNLMSHTAGIYFNSWKPGQGSGVISVTENLALNIDGRQSDGNGGYNGKFVWAQFLQFNTIQSNPKVEIAWNKTMNDPRQSFIEDTVNLYNSSGTPESKINIHDNLFQGAYAIDPSAVYSGGGIMIGDGCDSGYTKVSRNTVLETSNYGIAIANGSNQEVRDNVVLGRGKLDDGTLLDADTDAGIYARNYCNSPSQDKRSNFTTGNVVGWGNPTASNPNGRWDTSVDNAVDPANQSFDRITPLTGPIPKTIIEFYRQQHEDRAKAAGKKFGPS